MEYSEFLNKRITGAFMKECHRKIFFIIYYSYFVQYYTLQSSFYKYTQRINILFFTFESC